MERKRNIFYERVEWQTDSLVKWSLGLSLGSFNGAKLITLIGNGVRDLTRGAAFDSDNYYDLAKLQ